MSLENKLEQATGAVKEGFGKVTGDSKTELEGAVEKTVAKAKDVVEDAVEGLKNVFTK
ncbi:CsbD-like protein [Streptococcus pneumoniae]|nr:CsbD-like protein [Streptococcus pneumoniae]VPX09736.1 CsbD-like protein [Streptococcus pneumoniae]